MKAIEIKLSADQLAQSAIGHKLEDAFRMIGQLAERVAELEERRPTLTLKKP